MKRAALLLILSGCSSPTFVVEGPAPMPTTVPVRADATDDLDAAPIVLTYGDSAPPAPFTWCTSGPACPDFDAGADAPTVPLDASSDAGAPVDASPALEASTPDAEPVPVDAAPDAAPEASTCVGSADTACGPSCIDCTASQGVCLDRTCQAAPYLQWDAGPDAAEASAPCAPTTCPTCLTGTATCSPQGVCDCCIGSLCIAP
jgi:hypothetical protein